MVAENEWPKIHTIFVLRPFPKRYKQSRLVHDIVAIDDYGAW